MDGKFKGLVVKSQWLDSSQKFPIPVQKPEDTLNRLITAGEYTTGRRREPKRPRRGHLDCPKNLLQNIKYLPHLFMYVKQHIRISLPQLQLFLFPLSCLYFTLTYFVDKVKFNSNSKPPTKQQLQTLRSKKKV